jgi:hypothetical protein
MVDAAAMAKAAMSPETPITLRLRDVSFGVLVEQTLAGGAGRPGVLDWGVRDNVVEVRSADAFAADPILRIYDVGDFPDISGQGHDREAWIKLITAVVEPDSWTATGGRVEWFGQLLVVRQSPRAHRQIAGLLNDLDVPSGTPTADTQALELLSRRLPEVRFNERNLDDCVNFLRDLQRINILVNWPSLAAAKVTPNSSITFQAKDIAFDALFKRILDMPSERAEPVDFAVWDGIVHVSTATDLDRVQLVRVYDVSKVTAKVAPKQLVKELCAKVAPQSWGPKGTGRMVELGPRLVVRNSPRVQRELAAVLRTMGEGGRHFESPP